MQGDVGTTYNLPASLPGLLNLQEEQVLSDDFYAGWLHMGQFDKHIEEANRCIMAQLLSAD
ncbi:MAG: hypothetical protein NC355_00015 [Blautia sp.]|nr:hypothetical protein [Blautia sp.]